MPGRAPASRPAAPPPATPLERLRLPSLAREFVLLGADGGVLAARPETAAEHSERLARAMSLAAAALKSARLGAPRRAIMEVGDESYFVRADPALTLALALPRTTQITQGLLEVNRLWAAAGQEVRRVS